MLFELSSEYVLRLEYCTSFLGNPVNCLLAKLTARLRGCIKIVMSRCFCSYAASGDINLFHVNRKLRDSYL